MLSSAWPTKAIAAAATFTVGSVASTLFFQHVSNACPRYFYSLAIISPLSGFIVYSSMVLLQQYVFRSSQSALTLTKILHVMGYCIGIGICFAANNLLKDFGKSGSSSGVPDVSTVLSLVLIKLVVPVSLVLEASFERRRPTKSEISGVTILMIGVFASALMSSGHGMSHERSQLYGLKICCLSLSSIPLALGFYLVKATRQHFPDVTGIELWAILCVPELIFSILLTFASQLLKSDSGSVQNIAAELWDGILCIAFGFEMSESRCRDGSFFYWAGIPFGFALNLAIPILIKLKGSTSVPLFGALAIPIASLIAMTGIDRVVSTPFSIDAIFGVTLCTLGLFIFYQELSSPVTDEYSLVENVDDQESSIRSSEQDEDPTEV